MINLESSARRLTWTNLQVDKAVLHIWAILMVKSLDDDAIRF